MMIISKLKTVSFISTISLLLICQPFETNASCPNNCNFRGVCIGGQCECAEGYGGSACDVVTTGCPNNCFGHGDCFDGVCKCHVGFQGDACNLVSAACSQYLNCTGHGRCIEGACVCDSLWSGPNCDQYEAGKNCPVELNNCTGHGVCGKHNDDGGGGGGGGGDDDAIMTCQCEVGLCGKDCSYVCGGEICPSNCTGHGSCINGKCQCDDGFDGEACRHIIPVPGCPNFCSGKGSCVDNQCQCHSGRIGEDCGIVVDPSNEVIHGSCPTGGGGITGGCSCHPGWEGDLCSIPKLCANNCTGSGDCIDGVCKCYKGYAGPRCEHACPRGGTPFGCANRGKCLFNNLTQKAECFCFEEYQGSDCQWLSPYGQSLSDNSGSFGNAIIDSAAGNPIGIALLVLWAVATVVIVGGFAYNKAKGKTGMDAVPGATFFFDQLKKLKSEDKDPGYKAM